MTNIRDWFKSARVKNLEADLKAAQESLSALRIQHYKLAVDHAALQAVQHWAAITQPASKKCSVCGNTVVRYIEGEGGKIFCANEKEFKANA